MNRASQVGEIDIDSELVASAATLDGREESRIMMLNNGCLCCTVREDLVGMLKELVGHACPYRPLQGASVLVWSRRAC